MVKEAWTPSKLRGYMVYRKYIQDYELCLEIWHTEDTLLDEVTIHCKEVYFKNGAKIKRHQVPAHLLTEFDKWADEQWWTYCDTYTTQN